MNTITLTTPITNPPRAVGLLRGCRFVTPYTAGYEDFRYQRIKRCLQRRNPFKNDTAEFLQYDAGHTDARRNQEKL